MAYFLSQWLLCEHSGFKNSLDQEDQPSMVLFDSPQTPTAPQLRPCQKCVACQRALHQQGLDFTAIEPEEGESDSLKIEQFRKLKSSMGFGGFEGAFKITLIRNAERMTTQAANSLLKMLEEPPRVWIFFLTATDSALLLPTIVSRCQTLRLRPLSEDSLVSALQGIGIDASRATLAARLAQGSWSRAKELSDPEAIQQRQAILRFIESPAQELSSLVDWSTRDPEHLTQLLSGLESTLGQLLVWSLQPEAQSTQMERPLLDHAEHMTRKLGQNASRHFWTLQAENLALARQHSHAPLNKKLLVQGLLVPWLNRDQV